MVDNKLIREKMTSGYNCSQVVVDYFADDIGISRDLAKNMASLFGSGMNMESICGGVTGAYLVLGIKYGDNILLAKEKMKEFNDSFSKLNKSNNCFELLGYHMTIPEEREEATTTGIKDKICTKAVASSIEILETLL